MPIIRNKSAKPLEMKINGKKVIIPPFSEHRVPPGAFDFQGSGSFDILGDLPKKQYDR